MSIDTATETAPTGSDNDQLTVVRVQARGLTKRYGSRSVLRGVDLDIPAGQSVALFGPNGAGKTTLLRVLATLTRPARGTVRIDGFDSEHDSIEIRARIGVVAHQPFVYDSLTGRENLQFFARMFEVSEAETRIDDVLAMVELRDRAEDQVGTYSRGMLQRIALARAVLHRPTTLLLDEPDTGLDPASVRLLADVLQAHVDADGSILMTTHNLRFGLRNADRVLVLVGGGIAIDRLAEEIDTARIEAVMGAPGA